MKEKNYNRNILKFNRTIKYLFLLIVISFIAQFSTFASNSSGEKLYLAPPKDVNPQIYKYLFYIENDTTGTLIAQKSKQEGVSSKTDNVTQDTDSLENGLTIFYNNAGEPVRLKLKLKEKDKKVLISIFNIIGNKISDVFEGVPGDYETEYSLSEHTESLSNGLYICIVQGQNFRLKLYQKFTISR